ncbi:MAG: hypothetical protein DCC66_07005 [Planctomycetota bacterium]|nr:MAG: hypothetical protein DCC66_07005 [Planctomycetota bacterium]
MIQRLKLVSAALGFGIAFGPLTCVRSMGEFGMPGLAAVGAVGLATTSIQNAEQPSPNLAWPALPIEHRSTGG